MVDVESGFRVQTFPLVSEHATLVRVTHPVYGGAERLVSDIVKRDARFNVLRTYIQQMEAELLSGPVSRREQLSAILKEARVTP